MNDPDEKRLKGIRADVQITPSADDNNGVPSWVIHDNLQHRYFHINSQTKDVLSLWQEGISVDQLIEGADRQFGIKIDKEHVLALESFLRNNQLLIAIDQNSWRDYSQQEISKQQNFTTKIMKNYVFFKIPLFRPQEFLRAYLPLVTFFYSRFFVVFIVLAGLAGLYLVSRQWDGFVNDLQRFLSIEGITYFGVALIVVKVFHELGHAFTATRFGVQVPIMGVAFFLLTPLLFTDVSDAWRLPSRKKRLLISAAGIITELFIACIATLLWVFLPDGPTRDITLILASTSWIMSLAVNLNPLIKFDGYYLLTDLIGVDNLQQRSFALGKWKMREFLFSPGIKPPENFSDSMRRGLIWFAWMTWVYRLILFTTIALLVYHFAFKLLGIILFALEIWILLLKPVIVETKEWYKVGSKTKSPMRVMATLSTLLIAIGFFVIPRQSTIEIPAVLQAGKVAVVYPGSAAQISKVETRQGIYVEKGTPLLTLTNPEIDDRVNAAQSSIKVIKLRLANALVNQLDNEEMLVLNQTYLANQSKLVGLIKEKRELVIRAPISGYIQELNRELHSGRWIGKSEPVALISSAKTQTVRGFISASNLQRLTNQGLGKFVPDDLTRKSVDVKFKNIAKSGAETIDILPLASVHGGSIVVEPNNEGQLVPVQAQYLLEFKLLDEVIDHNQIVRGVVQFEGNSQSMLTRTWNQIAKVLIRETGF